MDLQRLGIDRKIVTKSGKQILIDEKKRRSTFNDILIEYISNDRSGAAGWIEKDLHIDYLAYAFMPIKTVHLFPFDLLRRAWFQFKDEWIASYQRVEADNGSYKTISVAIPTDTLRKAVSRAAIIKV